MAVKTVQAVVNGQTHTLNLNSATGKYETTITAPEKSSYPLSGHYYPVTVKAEDVAGNVTTADHEHSTLGESLKLKVKEKTAPVIAIIYPTASAAIANNKPTIRWKVTDNDSGVNQNTIGITIDQGSKITGPAIVKKAVTGGYECSYTPSQAMTDGQHTIKLDASDNDGNAAVQKSVQFKVDTVPPTLNLNNPVEDFVTNKLDILIDGTTNDLTSSPVTVTYKINNGEAVMVTVNSDGKFSITAKGINGENTIAVTARDSAGKETTITRHLTIDTVAPVIRAVTITPNPVDSGKTYIISVEVTD